MRLLYITNGICSSGGLERVLSIKASFFAKNYNYEIHIATLNENGKQAFYDFDKSIKFHNIATRKSSAAYICDYIKEIKKLIKDVKPDVISVCDDGLKAFFFPMLFGKKTPTIYERHISKFVFSNSVSAKLKYKIMDYFAKKFSRFVVLTQGNKNEWGNAKNIRIIANPLSFYPSAQSNLDNKKIIAVGKISYQKNFEALAKAWILVNKKHPDWEINIYGNLAQANNLEEFTKAQAIYKTFVLHAPQQNIESKYLESSIYVLSSRYEGFGMVLTEAMACGVPCVAFDCPCGPADIIKNNEDGFLVEPENIEKLAEKINYLIENDDIRKQMGMRARENVKRYLPENICAQWKKLFEEVCKK